jgi:hypothetical protein
MDAASEQLLSKDLEDAEHYSSSSEKYSERSLSAGQRHRLLEVLCALTVVTVGLLVAYSCGVRLVVVEAGPAGSRAPSGVADCTQRFLNLGNWLTTAFQRQHTEQ